jgi:DNA-binding NtrC family response regulator
VTDSKIKVLVAEDELHLGQILANFLGGRGYAVHTVTDGRAALESLRAEAYDVALLDIVMPEMDGLEVLKQVRADADPPEVIIITGNGTIETAISAMKLGARGRSAAWHARTCCSSRSSTARAARSRSRRSTRRSSPCSTPSPAWRRATRRC